MLGAEQRGDRRHLGLAEQQREVAPEAVEAGLDQRLGHRRHRVHRAAQARQVPIAERRVLQRGPVHHRQPEDLGDPLALDRVQEALRVEAAVDVQGGPDDHRGRAERVELRGVEHRHHRDEAVVRAPAGVQRRGHRLEVDRRGGSRRRPWGTTWSRRCRGSSAARGRGSATSGGESSSARISSRVASGQAHRLTSDVRNGRRRLTFVGAGRNEHVRDGGHLGQRGRDGRRRAGSRRRSRGPASGPGRRRPRRRASRG